MMRYYEKAAYIGSLRRTVLRSGDVLPDEVTRYLREAARGGQSTLHCSILVEWKPLIDTLPGEFADFILNVLVTRERRATVDSYGTIERPTLGVDAHLDEQCFSPFRRQGHGLFDYFLQRHEQEAMHLIHAVTNYVIDRWQEELRNRRQGQGEDVPAPIAIDLPYGKQEFIGNQEVYYWRFWHTGRAPNVVRQILNELRTWMLREIKRGRDAVALFEQVLRGSRCIALASSCVEVALTYPAACLEAVLPLVSSSVIWRLDARRSVYDHSELLGFAQENSVPRIGDRLPDVRNLAYYYLFESPETLRARFERSVSEFTDNLPFLFESERWNESSNRQLHELMENYQTFGRRDNYRFEAVEGGFRMWVVQPSEIQEQIESDLAPVHQAGHILSLVNWARETLESGRLAERWDVAEAIEAVKRLYQPTDMLNYVDEASNGYEAMDRLRALTGVTAAALVTDFEWVRRQGLVSECREVLLSAARLPHVEAMVVDNPRRFAALGLGALVKHGKADEEVRLQLLKLVADQETDVITAAFQGLHSAWKVDLVLYWNMLGLGLALSVQSDSDVDSESGAELLVEYFSRNLAAEQYLPLPQLHISEGHPPDFSQLASCLRALPLQELLDEEILKTEILGIVDDLMDITILENLSSSGEFDHLPRNPVEWNHFFLVEFIPHLVVILGADDAEVLVLSPVRQRWMDAPQVLSNLMHGYIKHCISPIELLPVRVVEQWRDICNWVLDSYWPSIWSRRDYLSSEVADIFSWIVFVWMHTPALTKTWPHIDLFVDIIDEWVTAIGGNADAFSSLLVLVMDGPGSNLSFALILDWLARSVRTTSDIAVFWSTRDNAEKAAMMLYRIWNEHRSQLFLDVKALQHFTDLTDRLVEVGTRLAGRLQQELEQ